MHFQSKTRARIRKSLERQQTRPSIDLPHGKDGGSCWCREFWGCEWLFCVHTWSSMVFTPSGPSASMAWLIRSVLPQFSIRKPRSCWNFSVAALASSLRKELKQHSGLGKTKEFLDGAHTIKKHTGTLRLSWAKNIELFKKHEIKIKIRQGNTLNAFPATQLKEVL